MKQKHAGTAETIQIFHNVGNNINSIFLNFESDVMDHVNGHANDSGNYKIINKQAKYEVAK